jgi:hypothetical protein
MNARDTKIVAAWFAEIRTKNGAVALTAVASKLGITKAEAARVLFSHNPARKILLS